MYTIRKECYYYYTGWPNDKNKSCSSSKVIEICSRTILHLNYFCQGKVNLNFWNLKIWICQTTSNGETLNMKVVDTKKLWNFVVYNFFIWNHVVNEIQNWISQIWNSNFVNNLKWKNSKHESCRSQKVMKISSWQNFNLNLFRA
jgi:hypothetical protein